MKDPWWVIQDFDLKSEKKKAHCRKPIQVSIILVHKHSNNKIAIKRTKVKLAPNPQVQDTARGYLAALPLLYSRSEVREKFTSITCDNIRWRSILLLQSKKKKQNKSKKKILPSL
jgi:hypothetical protein